MVGNGISEPSTVVVGCSKMLGLFGCLELLVLLVDCLVVDCLVWKTNRDLTEHQPNEKMKLLYQFAPETLPGPKRKGSFSNHHLSKANCYIVLGGVLYIKINHLGGGFKDFSFSPLHWGLGKRSNLTCAYFSTRWFKHHLLGCPWYLVNGL